MKPVSAKTPRLADRLAGAREVRFVARRMELDQFSSALAAERPPFSVLTCMVRAASARRRCCASSRASPETRIARCSRSTDAISAVAPGTAPRPRRGPGRRRRRGARFALPDRSLVLIDTYEALATLDTWLRETLLPDLPAGVLIVLAGRDAPALPWRTDVAWSALTRVIPLGNFAPARASPSSSPAASRRRPTQTCWTLRTGTRSRCRWSPTCSPNGRTPPSSIRTGRRTLSGICSRCFSTRSRTDDSAR